MLPDAGVLTDVEQREGRDDPDPGPAPVIELPEILDLVDHAEEPPRVRRASVEHELAVGTEQRSRLEFIERRERDVGLVVVVNPFVQKDAADVQGRGLCVLTPELGLECGE